MNKLIMPHMAYPESGAYVGEPGEMVFDTTFQTVRVHNGQTPGGVVLPNEAPTTGFINQKLTYKFDKVDVGSVVPGLNDNGILPEEYIRHDSYLRDPHNDLVLGRKNGRWVALDIPEHVFIPGASAVVAGDTTAGYYGQVEQSQLIDYRLLTDMLGVKGRNPSAGGGWLKFSLDGKTLFMSMKPVLQDVTYKELYQKGLVYGVDGPGTHPYGDPVNQNRVVHLWGHNYRVRLMSGSTEDPVVDADSWRGLEDHASQVGSEWDRLMIKVDARPNPNETEPKWASLESGDIGSGEAWVQEKAGRTENGLDYRIGRRVGYSNNETENTAGNSESAWRPVLELID